MVIDLLYKIMQLQPWVAYKTEWLGLSSAMIRITEIYRGYILMGPRSCWNQLPKSVLEHEKSMGIMSILMIRWIVLVCWLFLLNIGVCSIGLHWEKLGSQPKILFSFQPCTGDISLVEFHSWSVSNFISHSVSWSICLVFPFLVHC